MANQEHVAELLKGVASWNKWIAGEREKNLNFRADLEGIDLSEARFRPLYGEFDYPFWIIRTFKCCQPDLQGIDLRRVKLNKSSFAGANLCGSVFEESFCYKAHLDGAELSKAHLKRANMQRAHLEGARLEDAHLEEVMLRHAHLEEANLQGTHLERATLDHAHLERAILFSAYLKGATLLGAHLEDADMRSADFSNARLLGVSYNGDTLLSHLATWGLWQLYRWKKDKGWRFSKVKHRWYGGCQWVRRAVVTLHGQMKNRKVLFGREFKEISWARYKGIRVETCLGNQRFRRFAMDQAFIEELRDSQSGLDKWWYKIWYYSSDCGRSVFVWSFWSLVLAMAFALVFWWAEAATAPGHAFHFVGDVDGTPLLAPTFGTMLYYSIVTFTTLGFGDVTPLTGWMRFFVTIEVILGYFMLGALISIFANKFARRSG